MPVPDLDPACRRAAGSQAGILPCEVYFTAFHEITDHLFEQRGSLRTWGTFDRAPPEFFCRCVIAELGLETINIISIERPISLA